MKTYDLPGLDQWDDFDRAAQALNQMEWKSVREVEGPDARIGHFEKDGHAVRLIYDDLIGTCLKTDDQKFDLQPVAERLLKILTSTVPYNK